MIWSLRQRIESCMDLQSNRLDTFEIFFLGTEVTENTEERQKFMRAIPGLVLIRSL